MSHRSLSTLSLLTSLAAFALLTGCREGPPADDDAVTDDDTSLDDDSAADDDTVTDDDDATGDDYRHELTVTKPLVGDLSCITTPQDPGAALHTDETAELQGLVLDFSEDENVVGAYVNVWGDNDSTQAPAWESAEDDPDGTSTDGLAAVPSGIVYACTPYAYLTYTNFNPATTQPTYELGTILPPSGGAPWSGGDANFTSVSYVTAQLIPLTLSIDPAAGKGIAAGTFEDCNGDPIANGQVIVRDGDGNKASDVYIRYFVDELPDRDQQWTSEDGLFGAIDVPVGSWFMELWGVPNGFDTAGCLDTDADGRCLVTRIGIYVDADSVNIANAKMKPYPEACFTP